jgi:hypothetical protein
MADLSSLFVINLNAKPYEPFMFLHGLSLLSRNLESM